eukprot:m.680 g.680  ORF g.680 m.680 type:complete len:108 (-) comp151_c1_seq1:290-613(-)
MRRQRNRMQYMVLVSMHARQPVMAVRNNRSWHAAIDQTDQRHGLLLAFWPPLASGGAKLPASAAFARFCNMRSTSLAEGSGAVCSGSRGPREALRDRFERSDSHGFS